MTFAVVKRVIAIALLSMYMLQLGANVSKLAWYELNKDYITALFCVNQDKPELQCQGKCHLKMQIENDEEDRSEAAIELAEIVWISFVQDEYICCNAPNKAQIRFTFPVSEWVNYDSYLAGVFRPPQNSFCHNC